LEQRHDPMGHPESRDHPSHSFVAGIDIDGPAGHLITGDQTLHEIWQAGSVGENGDWTTTSIEGTFHHEISLSEEAPSPRIIASLRPIRQCAFIESELGERWVLKGGDRDDHSHS
jgi:hypothetical protein